MLFYVGSMRPHPLFFFSWRSPHARLSNQFSHYSSLCSGGPLLLGGCFWWFVVLRRLSGDISPCLWCYTPWCLIMECGKTLPRKKTYSLEFLNTSTRFENPSQRAWILLNLLMQTYTTLLASTRCFSCPTTLCLTSDHFAVSASARTFCQKSYFMHCSKRTIQKINSWLLRFPLATCISANQLFCNLQ